MCFGAQVLAQAFGGRVGKNPGGGFVLKVEAIQLSDTLRSCAAMQQAAADAAAAGGDAGGAGSGSNGSSSSAPACVRLIQSHGDQVLQLPPGCVLLAGSPTAPIEMFSNAAGNVLAVQVRNPVAASSARHCGLRAAGWLSAPFPAWAAAWLNDSPLSNPRAAGPRRAEPRGGAGKDLASNHRRRQAVERWAARLPAPGAATRLRGTRLRGPCA